MLESSFHSSLRWFHVGSIHPPQPYAATCRLPQQWAREEPAGKHSHGIPCKLVSEKKTLNTTKIGEKSEAPNHTENPTRMHTENTSLARYFEAYPALQDDLELTSICWPTWLCPTNRCTSGVIPEMIKCSFCGSHRVSRYFTRKQGSGRVFLSIFSNLNILFKCGPTTGPPIKLRPAIATRSFGWVKIAYCNLCFHS